jgi:hypothetical protein
MPSIAEDIDASVTAAVDTATGEGAPTAAAKRTVAIVSGAHTTASATALHPHPSGGLTSWQRMSGNLPLTEMSFWGSASGAPGQ